MIDPHHFKKIIFYICIIAVLTIGLYFDSKKTPRLILEMHQELNLQKALSLRPRLSGPGEISIMQPSWGIGNLKERNLTTFILKVPSWFGEWTYIRDQRKSENTPLTESVGYQLGFHGPLLILLFLLLIVFEIYRCSKNTRSNQGSHDEKTKNR